MDGRTLVPARLLEGRIFVPLRFLVEAMGMAVDWDQAARRVAVSERDLAAPAPAPPRLEKVAEPVLVGAIALWSVP